MLTLHAFTSFDSHNNPVFLQMSKLLLRKINYLKASELAAFILAQAVRTRGRAVNHTSLHKFSNLICF